MTTGAGTSPLGGSVDSLLSKAVPPRYPLLTMARVEISDEHLHELEEVAAREGLTLQELLHLGIEWILIKRRPIERMGNVPAGPGGSTFAQRWRGSFRPRDSDDERYRRLAGKYL